MHFWNSSFQIACTNPISQCLVEGPAALSSLRDISRKGFTSSGSLWGLGLGGPFCDPSLLLYAYLFITSSAPMSVAQALYLHGWKLKPSKPKAYQLPQCYHAKDQTRCFRPNHLLLVCILPGHFRLSSLQSQELMLACTDRCLCYLLVANLSAKHVLNLCTYHL